MNIKSKLQRWLEIPKKTEPVIPKDWTEDFKKLEQEQWKNRQLLKKRVIVKCPVCTKSLLVWPLETEAYYMRDGKAYHTDCYKSVVQ
jgi:hypothetical protein